MENNDKPSFDFKIEILKENIFVCVTKDHTFGIDAFLLANFANPKRKDIVCDFGTGCGIIPMYMAGHYTPKTIYGVDIAKKAIEQFDYSKKISQTTSNLIAICTNLKNITDIIAKNSCDLVVMNPPYKTLGSGIVSDNDAAKIARHEVETDILDIAKSASDILKNGGKFCICQRPERLLDAFFAFRKNNIEPKYLRFVKSKAEKQAFLFLLEGRKNEKPFLKIEKDLVVYDGNNFSDEMNEIYKTYRN